MLYRDVLLSHTKMIPRSSSGMGTKVQFKSYLAGGYNTMRDINEDSNSSSWPHFYGDKPLTNEQYYNNFTPRTVTDSYPAYDKDVLKQKMLEHEAIFKNQVCFSSYFHDSLKNFLDLSGVLTI